MNNDVNNTNSLLPIWKVIVKKWFIILIVAVLFFGASFVYTAVKVKPTYTAKWSIMLKMSISDTVNASTNTNNATLAKRNLPTLKECITSQKVADAANEFYDNMMEYYNQGTLDDILNFVKDEDKAVLEKLFTGKLVVNKSNISVVHGESSMIFQLGYTDYDADVAQFKCELVLQGAKMILPDKIEAENVELVPVQYFSDVAVNDKSASYIVVGTIIGLFAGVLLVLFIHLLDNKVRRKEEIEELTGTSVLAFIENE